MTTLTNPDTGESKSYTFDYSYNSHVAQDHPEYASQDNVWKDLGESVLKSAWEGAILHTPGCQILDL